VKPDVAAIKYLESKGIPVQELDTLTLEESIERCAELAKKYMKKYKEYKKTGLWED
jgi:hypothetical protein